VHNGNQENAPLGVDVLAEVTAKPSIFSSQFYILAPASSIFSLYPDIPGITANRNAIHGVCYPRQMLVEGSSPGQEVNSVHQMWSRALPSQLRG
jgi:hypothetical protein